MAKNDIVLIDAIVDERLKQGYPSSMRDEVFEFFAFEQLLKDFDLSREEIEGGWVDGRDDGGIDGFFVFVNGHLLQDPLTFSWPKRNTEIEVWVLTCKHHATFQQAPVNCLLASIPELFDLSVGKAQLRGEYSPEILAARALFHNAYRHLSVARATLGFRFGYVSRGNSSAVAPNVRARADQLIRDTQDLFSQCASSFEFVGAEELVSRYRQTKTFSLDLPVLECITRESGSYVALTRLDDYCHFITDEGGNLRRYLFDSNVRDYLGENPVNEDIRESLKDGAAPEFWWLNNGVTLLATAANVVGKVLQLHDIQIVNGLQTTESIFRHFGSGSTISADRGLLVKVVVSTETAVRDQIIRATNNQTVVEQASLHATDKLQRDIEDILERHEWYYERRKNYYRNIGRPRARFVTPMYLAAGYVALIMKNPALAARFKARFIRTEERYSIVFSEHTPLQAWVTITEVLKRVEDALTEVRPTQSGESERFLAKWRNLIALLTVAKVLGRFSYGVGDLVGLDVRTVTRAIAVEMWNLVQLLRRGSVTKREFRNHAFIQDCCNLASTSHGIADPQVVGARSLPSGKRVRKSTLPEEFIHEVNGLLPAQPWKPRIHAEIAAQLGRQPGLVWEAIEELVRRGTRLLQVDGVVYDRSGRIVAVDKERVKNGELLDESQ